MKNISIIQSDSVAKIRIDSIRAKIKKIQPDIFIEFCMQYNLQKFDSHLDMLKHLPWVVNLCIKWASTSIGKNKIFQSIEKSQLTDILQNVYDNLSIIPIGLEKTNGVDFFLRNNLYQQGIYQKKDAMNTICRQVFIFNSIDSNHRIQKKFKELTGVSIEHFLQLSFVLIKYITDEAPVRKITLNTFQIFSSFIPKEVIANFLDVISIDYSDIARFSRNNTYESPLLEYFSSSPFLEKPLIKKENEYYQIHTQLTSTSIQTFIYDFLRRNNAATFMDSFGKVFENALKTLLNEAEFTYYDECCLIEKLPRDNKVVDFLIPHEDANIFIDAKGVEIHQKGMVTLRPNDISGKIKGSVLKAIEQAHAVNREILNPDNKLTPFRKESYVICVTYKNLFLGNGSFLMKSFAREEMRKIQDRHSEEYIIPAENIFCLAFEEFEYLMASCRFFHKHPHEVLRMAVEMNKTPSSAVFLFSQHIERFFEKVKPSEIVTQTGINMMEGVIAQIQKHQEKV